MRLAPIQTVLHIDDDSEFHEIFCIALEELALDVQYVPFTSALEALSELKNTELAADLIILDLNMPVMDGHQFLAEVKNVEVLRDIPVIVFSTTSHPRTIEKSKNLGAHEFITKPGSYTQLINTVSGIFSNPVPS